MQNIVTATLVFLQSGYYCFLVIYTGCVTAQLICYFFKQNATKKIPKFQRCYKKTSVSHVCSIVDENTQFVSAFLLPSYGELSHGDVHALLGRGSPPNSILLLTTSGRSFSPAPGVLV